MIVSVPHTGTRSLIKILGAAGNHHFCQNEGDFTVLKQHIDFPVRDPLDTCISWRSYQCDREDMDEFRRWEAAIDYLEDYPHGVTYYVMEHYGTREGRGPAHWSKDALEARDLESLKKLPEVRYLLEWIKRPKIARFFSQFYYGFWWNAEDEQPQATSQVR